MSLRLELSLGPAYFVVTNLLPRYGIEAEVVDGTDLEAWEKALSKGAAAVFLETPVQPQL